MELKRILAPTDFSENADYAFQCSVFSPPTAITCEERCLHLTKMKAAA